MDIKLTYDQVRDMYAKAGYRFYDSGKFNVNIFGVRNDLAVDLWNDTIGIAYRDENNTPQVKLYAGTTKPGLFYLKNKLGNIKGTFILKPGYYSKCWIIGKHKGEYEALVQAGPGVFTGWRDGDSDGQFDMTGPLHTDVAGLNLHTTSHLRGSAVRVGAYSASCQVIQKTKEHTDLMALVKRSADIYGNHFSYALFSNV